MVAMTRDEWVAKALGRAPAHVPWRGFGSFGTLPSPAKIPTSGALAPIDASQVTTREIAQQIADDLSRTARSAYDAVVHSLSVTPGLPDSDAWKARVKQQADSAVGYRNQVFQSTSGTSITWSFVVMELRGAWSMTNMALATVEQLGSAISTWTAQQRAAAQAAADRAAADQAAATRAQADAARALAAQQAAAQQAQLDLANQAAELQRQIAASASAGGSTAAQAQAAADLAAAQAALDAWTAAHPPGQSAVNVSVSAGGGGGAPSEVPSGAESLSPASAEPGIPKILLYGLAGLAALKILKG